MENKLWNALKELKSEGYEWVELSHSLNNDSPFWSGIPEGSVELSKVVFDWGNPMLECLIHTFKFPGQFGTHVDFPGHFVKDAPLSEQYGVKDFVFPLAVIDISEKVKGNVDYAVTVEDIKAYEEKYGPIPEGAFVALRTDWYKRWPDMDKLSNVGADGNEHCPGWSIDALKYIFEVRKARWIRMPVTWLLKPVIWPASVLYWHPENFRLKCFAIWTKWLLPALYCLRPGRVSRVQPVCRRECTH